MRGCALTGLSLQTTSPLLNASRSTFAAAASTSRLLNVKKGQTRILVTCRPRQKSSLLTQALSNRPSPPSSLLAESSTTTMQTRSHFGHSHHGHHHHHDTTFLTSTDKNDAGVRITRVGLFVNLGMAIAKGFGGYAFNSKACVTLAQRDQRHG